MDPENILSKAVNWEFLNEPIWRWTVFMIAMGGITAAWSGVIRHIKS